MTFGSQVKDQPMATRMIDFCIDAGINFFDTANMYQLGESETMLGEALRGRRRAEVVLAGCKDANFNTHSSLRLCTLCVFA